MSRWFFLAVSIPAAFSLGACSGNRINGEDDPVFLPSVQVGALLGKRKPDSPRIELSLARGSGSFDQEMHDPTLQVDTVTFLGPSYVHVDATITSGSLRFVQPIMFRKGTIGLEWAAGWGAMRHDITVSNAQTSARITEADSGPNGGIAFLLRDPEHKLGLRLGLDVTIGIASQRREELLGVFAPSPGFELMFGWRATDYSFSGENEIDILFKGPAAGLRLMF